MSDCVLLCTVGGSHQPILKAIKSNSPAFVCFFCTDKDPETGMPGSLDHVTGEGKVIKASPRDEKPTLENIPKQAGLDADRFQARTVPADDLDGAWLAMRDAVTALAGRFPDARFIGDYTGGTKTMTVALVCTALAQDVELQLVAGARSNLVRVKDGTEQAMTASVARLRLDRAMAPYLGAWRRFAYHEAADGLEGIRIAANAPDRARLGLARAFSRALALWDDFDHAGALARIDVYARWIARDHPAMLPALRLLAGQKEQRVPALLFDLWWNAKRRAAQGRFDDAVARWYRLTEWTAQWQIRAALDADTADFPRERLPPDAEVVPARDGRIKIGLWMAWQVVGHCLRGPAQELVAKHGNALRHLLDLRNGSILAHGFRPIGTEDWQKVHSFTEEQFLPVLRDLARDAGLKSEPQQLPAKPPELVLWSGT